MDEVPYEDGQELKEASVKSSGRIHHKNNENCSILQEWHFVGNVFINLLILARLKSENLRLGKYARFQ